MLGPERERYNLWEWNTYENGDRGLLNQSLELAFGTFARITFGMGMSIPSCNLEVRSRFRGYSRGSIRIRDSAHTARFQPIAASCCYSHLAVP